ncbi:MAG: DUF6642 family protein [Candidatus Eisenbacteria bacterium]
MRKRGQTKGIFCIEGIWDPDLRTPSSVEPLLDLLNLNALIDYIHVDCATIEEFELYIGKWMQKRYDRYPILYLATHGSARELQIGKHSYSIDDLGKLMEGKCANRFIMFSSCSTLRIDRRVLRRFLDRTQAMAVCGYRVDVDWMRSTAFELLILSQIQKNEFSGRGAQAIDREAKRTARSFKDLDFSIVTVRDLKD